MSKNVAVAVQLSSLAVQLLVLASPPFPSRKPLGVTIIIALAIATHFTGPAGDTPGDAQPFALLWATYVGTLDKLLCAVSDGPEDSYWRVDRPAREARAMAAFGPRKLKWAAAMMFNGRGVRWNYEVKNLPPKPNKNKGAFLFSQVLVFLKMLFMSDLLLQLSERLFWTPQGGVESFSDSKTLSIRHQEWGWSFLKVLVFACGPYFFVNMQYVAGSIVAVALNLSRVEDWPPYFGNVSEVTTVRHFWGTFWQQSLRRTLTKFTGFVVDFFSIPRGTNLSSYTQIWLAFALSGFFHAQSMLLLPRPTNITTAESTFGVMAFFLWQAAAITVEDFVQWVWKKVFGNQETLPSIFKTLIGYTWVIVSFWISLPWAADVMMRIRLTEKSFLGFSVVRNFVQRMPIPPQ